MAKLMLMEGSLKMGEICECGREDENQGFIYADCMDGILEFLGLTTDFIELTEEELEKFGCDRNECRHKPRFICYAERIGDEEYLLTIENSIFYEQGYYAHVIIKELKKFHKKNLYEMEKVYF